MPSLSVLHIAAIAWGLTVTLSDLLRRRIPNLLSLGACAVATLILLIQGASATGGAVASALAAAALSIGFTLPAYFAGGLGAGDVKLAVAIGLLSDVKTVLATFVVGSLIGGIWVVLWVLYRYAPLLAIWMEARGLSATGRSATRRPVPFGAALAVSFTASLVLRAVGPTL